MDVLHSRVIGWKTYTLSCSDETLRQLVRLAIMDCQNESGDYCEMFLLKINSMIHDYLIENNEPTRPFNPYHLKDDEHAGNKVGMESVFGKKFIEERTSSCEYHFDKKT